MKSVLDESEKLLKNTELFKTGISQAAHGSEFALGTFESVMAVVKYGEVASFIGQLGVEAAELA